jgi:hypothetical protein
VPRADGATAGAGPRVRYRVPATSAITMSRPPVRYPGQATDRPGGTERGGRGEWAPGRRRPCRGG